MEKSISKHRIFTYMCICTYPPIPNNCMCFNTYMYTFQYTSRCKTTRKILSSPCQQLVSLTDVSNKAEPCKELNTSSVGVSIASAINFL